MKDAKNVAFSEKSEKALAEVLGQELVSAGDLVDEFYVLGNKEIREQIIAAKIAGAEQMDEEYALINFGKVPRGQTLNLLAFEYAEERKVFGSFRALAFDKYRTLLLSTTYCYAHHEEPEALVKITPKYSNRLYIAQGSVHSPGSYILASGVPLDVYSGEYEVPMLAIARPLLYEEVELCSF